MDQNIKTEVKDVRLINNSNSSIVANTKVRINDLVELRFATFRDKENPTRFFTQQSKRKITSNNGVMWISDYNFVNEKHLKTCEDMVTKSVTEALTEKAKKEDEPITETA